MLPKRLWCNIPRVRSKAWPGTLSPYQVEEAARLGVDERGLGWEIDMCVLVDVLRLPEAMLPMPWWMKDEMCNVPDHGAAAEKKVAADRKGAGSINSERKFRSNVASVSDN